MNLHDHAAAITAAIQAAHDDGFELDNGDGEPIPAMDLNSVDGDQVIEDWASIALPKSTYF